MFHLTPQEKSVLIGLCIVVLVGTMVNIYCQKDLCLSSRIYPTPKKSFTATININKASAEELLKVPGIGPKTAEFIMNYRHSKGLFKNLEPLHQAKGMSPERYERLLQYLHI